MIIVASSLCTVRFFRRRLNATWLSDVKIIISEPIVLGGKVNCPCTVCRRGSIQGQYGIGLTPAAKQTSGITGQGTNVVGSVGVGGVG